MKFVLASHNKGKLAEMQRILGQLGVEVVLQSDLGLALEPEENGTTFAENASIVISTHLIADVENILDDVIFIRNGGIMLQSSVDEIRQERGCSVDELFREVFRYVG